MITLIFATFNGQETLPKMLDAFLDLEIPECGMEIIAVDNASTDKTRDVIISYRDKLSITYLYEEKKGKNYALNKALDIAQGDLFVFTDDDIIPSRDWLTEITACADTNKKYHIFAGRILPKWPKEPSFHNTFSQGMKSICYAITRDDLQDGEIDAKWVWGANMAVRAEVFENGTRFNTGIGPDGSSSYSMGSETELTRRLQSLGYKSHFSNKAAVRHMIRLHQMPWRWMKQRAKRYGRGRVAYLVSSNCVTHEMLEHRYFGVPRYLYRELLSMWLRKLRAIIVFSPTKYYTESWEICCLQGQMSAFREKAKAIGEGPTL